jgi:hypothetical protein
MESRTRSPQPQVGRSSPAPATNHAGMVSVDGLGRKRLP